MLGWRSGSALPLQGRRTGSTPVLSTKLFADLLEKNCNLRRYSETGHHAGLRNPYYRFKSCYLHQIQQKEEVMKIIENNNPVEKRIICENCKSILEIEKTDVCRSYFCSSSFNVKCPCCKSVNRLEKNPFS